MSARYFSWGVLCACAVVAVQPAKAFEIPDVLADPLYAYPPMLEQGISLPNDAQPLVCNSVAIRKEALSLADVVDIALCNNPQVQAAWAGIRIQAAALGEARAAYMPTLTGTTSRLNNRIHYPDATSNDSKSRGETVYAGLSWRLFDFGGRAANREAANKLLLAAMLSLDASLQKTLATSVSAYFDVVTSEGVMTARRDASRLATETLNATVRRQHKGAAAQSDTLQARAALAKAQLAEQRAIGDYQKALSVLIYTMNLPPSTAVSLAVASDETQTESTADLAQWLADTTAQHPAILAARAQFDAARAKVENVRGEGLPTIDFVGNYYRNGYPNQGLQSTKSDTTTWGITLSIPLFEGFARTYKIRGAEAQAEQSAAQLAETERQILADVVKAYADVSAFIANLNASAELLEAAKAAVASSEKRYEKGAADILELLAAQSALADARQERVRCLSEWRSARLRLMANAGTMSRLAVK